MLENMKILHNKILKIIIGISKNLKTIRNKLIVNFRNNYRLHGIVDMLNQNLQQNYF